MTKPVLLIDNFDSFTHMLADYMMQCDIECVIARNNEQALLLAEPKNFLALVLSPGPETPQKAGLLMQVLPAFLEQIPVLGVCLGHQAIGLHYGAKLEHAGMPKHGKVMEHTHKGGLLFKEVPNSFLATRYHSLILKDLPACLKANCFCGEEIMALEHTHLPVYGLQFHPESCETRMGLTMIKNFIEEAKRIARN